MTTTQVDLTATQPAIVTLTMNPALDVTATVDRVRPTSKIRCHRARHDPGGGGVNVARTAHVLGTPTAAVFPAGGQTGDLLVDLLTAEAVPLRVVEIDGCTRENFTVNEDCSGEQYRFVLPGPALTLADCARCLDELRTAAGTAQFVVASGSLPPGAPADFYQEVSDICGQLGVRLILDASGAALQHVGSGVFLLKPSVRELNECAGRTLTTEDDLVAAAGKLIDDARVEVVVVSRGARGALVVTADEGHRFEALRTRPVSSVGAGDAMVAAITVGLSRGWPLTTAVRFGIAASTAMLLTPGTEVCNRGDVERLFGLVAEPAKISVAAH